MLVSVCVITFNHEKYIEQAIKSILSQETNFPIELVIGDDCSIDNTSKIILKYKKKYPKKIVYLRRKKNLGMMKNFIDTLKHCRGRYIAMCEGDDCWIDPNKLQKQVDFLENNLEFSISSHNVFIKDEITGKQHEWLGKQHRRVSTLKEILRYGSGGATCSLVIRSQVIKVLPAWFKSLPGGDWALQVLACKEGNLIYMLKPMAVYRRHEGGKTNVTKPDDLIRIYDKGGVEICKIFDKYLKYKYHDDIEYNLVNYFYPQLFKAFKQIGGRKKASDYAKLILKKANHLSFKKWLLYKCYSLLNF